MLILRRDRREPVVAQPSVEEPPAVVVEATPPAPRVQQLYPETDGVSDVEPARGYWSAPLAPPAHWSDPPQFGERESA